MRRSLALTAPDDTDDAEERDGVAFLRGDTFAHFVRRYYLELLLRRPALVHNQTCSLSTLATHSGSCASCRLTREVTASLGGQESEEPQVECLRWARLLYVATLTQATVTLAATYSNNKGLGKQPARVYRFLLALQHADAGMLAEDEGEQTMPVEPQDAKGSLGHLLDRIADASNGALRLAHANWTSAQWNRCV
jgi:hypothetical protein